jgi:hypothetical protein
MSYHLRPESPYPHAFLWMPWPPDNSAVTVVDSNTFLTEVREWCYDRGITYFISMMVNRTDFSILFQHERDAFEFKMRWV